MLAAVSKQHGARMKTRKLGGDGTEVSAIAFGGMLLSISGKPPEDQAMATVHAALDAGITLIDTADAYCTDDRDFNHNEALLRTLLADRKEDVLVATKCACRRPGGAWTVDGRPEVLKAAAESSLAALGVERLALLQLHAPDNHVPFEDSVGALAELVKEGKVERVGLSNVSVAEIEKARGIVPIVSVQNRWNVDDRSAEKDGVLDYCAKHQIAFLAYSPFGGTRGAPLLSRVGRLSDEARRRKVSVYELVLAWMLAKSPVAIPIVGARRPESITGSANAADLNLGRDDILAIEAAMGS